jgi:hypothetical protein
MAYAWFHFGRDRESSGKNVKLSGSPDSSFLCCSTGRLVDTLPISFS